MLGIVTVYAQQMPVPVEDQAPLFFKILSFNRNLKVKSGDKLTIAVIYQEKYRSSKVAQNEFVAFVKNNKELQINGFRVKCVPVDLADLTAPVSSLNLKEIDAFYVTPIRAFDITEICRLSRTRKIITMSGVPDYVSEGISIGLDIEDEHPKILINLNAARSEGIDFNSQLLKLVKVIE